VLLPNWAQLLDLAARLTPVSEEVRHWFSRLTNGTGVEASRTVLERCVLLRTSIQQHRDSVTAELLQNRSDGQPSQILEAWMYSLGTMMQQAEVSKTCAWHIEGAEDDAIDDSDEGDIALRRV